MMRSPYNQERVIDLNAEYFVVPENVNGDDIRVIRKRSGLTQKQFARWCNVSVKTVERWESGKETVHGPLTTLLVIMLNQPDLVRYYNLVPSEYRMRLFYYYRNFLCTVIDVDERMRKVQIHNYVDDVQMRAFGVIDNPSFDQYEEFLESRCFPRNADKMKIRLRELDLPFYDPLMIVEKTEGRMAEDEFWIRMERMGQ